MKTTGIILIILAAAFIQGCVSSQKATAEQMTHQYIIQYDSLTQKVIFDRTLKWVSNRFISAKNVLDYQDKEAGTIVLKGNVDVEPEGSGILGASTCAFVLNIDVRDGKSRYSFNNLQIYLYKDWFPVSDNLAWHKAFRLVSSLLIKDLEKFVRTPDTF